VNPLEKIKEASPLMRRFSKMKSGARQNAVQTPAGCGKKHICCHPEWSEGSAFYQYAGKKQIPPK
jgi:hypothetical protein